MPTMTEMLRDTRGELKSTREKFALICKEGGGGDDIDLEKVTCISGTVDEKLNEMRKLNERMDALGAKERELSATAKAIKDAAQADVDRDHPLPCLLYTSPSPRDS